MHMQSHKHEVFMIEQEVAELLKDLGDDKYRPEFTKNSYKYLPFVFGKLRNAYKARGLEIDSIEHFKITEAQGKFAELLGAKIEEVTGIKYSVVTDPGCEETGLLDGKTEEEKQKIRKNTLQAKGVDFQITGPGYCHRWDIKVRKCQWLYEDVLLKENLLKHPDWYETDSILYIKEMPKLEDSTVSILPVKPLQEAYEAGVVWRPWVGGPDTKSLMVENAVLQRIFADAPHELSAIDTPIY